MNAISGPLFIIRAMSFSIETKDKLHNLSSDLLVLENLLILLRVEKDLSQRQLDTLSVVSVLSNFSVVGKTSEKSHTNRFKNPAVLAV